MFENHMSDNETCCLNCFLSLPKQFQNLCSYDQYSNLVLKDSYERRIVVDQDGVAWYHDIPLGVYVVRGESMVLIGKTMPVDQNQFMKKCSTVEELETIQKERAKEPLDWDFDADLVA